MILKYNLKGAYIYSVDFRWRHRNLAKQFKPSILIFDDNDMRKGKEGQSIIRGLKNTFGIRTKKGQGKTDNCYYTDEEYDKNIKKIDEDLNLIIKKYDSGETIVFTSEGYGADLSKKAPKTYLYLCYKMALLFEFDNYSVKI